MFLLFDLLFHLYVLLFIVDKWNKSSCLAMDKR
jgi:hypothetical protein